MIWNSYPKPYVVFIANLPHMQLAISLSFVKLLWPLVRFISYSHDQDHVHVHTICYASTRGASTPLIHPQNKTPCLCMTPISENCIKDMGLCKKKKKDAYPKKVCHMPRHDKKKKKIKEAYPKKVCHMLRHVKKKWEEIAPIQKKEREMVHTKESIHHPPKISTHLHILIKVYDLFLLWIRSLT